MIKDSIAESLEARGLYRRASFALGGCDADVRR